MFGNGRGASELARSPRYYKCGFMMSSGEWATRAPYKGSSTKIDEKGALDWMCKSKKCGRN